MKVYIASPFFTKTQIEEITEIENLLGSYSWLEVISPRKIFHCPPNASQETKKKTFDGNVEHVRTCDFILGNTADKDHGSTVEFGMGYAFGKKIVFFCSQLQPGQLFNLMLAEMSTKVCTSIEQLKDYLDRVEANGCELINEPYAGDIE